MPEYKPVQTPIISITNIDDGVWSAITTKDVKVDIDNLVKEWNARFGLQLPSEVELNKFLDLYYIYGENTENIYEKKEENMNINERRAKFAYEGVRLHAIQLKYPVIPKPWDEREEDFKKQFRKLISDLYLTK